MYLDKTLVLWEPRAQASEATQLGLPVASSSPEASASPFRYYLYHKPEGVTCTMDPNDASSMANRLDTGGGRDGRLWPVGRLDKDSTGLVLLTDDGALSEALMDPAAKQEKEYLVTLRDFISDGDVERLANGVVITTPMQRGPVRSLARPFLPGAGGLSVCENKMGEERRAAVCRMPVFVRLSASSASGGESLFLPTEGAGEGRG